MYDTQICIQHRQPKRKRKRATEKRRQKNYDDNKFYFFFLYFIGIDTLEMKRVSGERASSDDMFPLWIVSNDTRLRGKCSTTDFNWESHRFSRCSELIRVIWDACERIESKRASKWVLTLTHSNYTCYMRQRLYCAIAIITHRQSFTSFFLRRIFFFVFILWSFSASLGDQIRPMLNNKRTTTR